MYWNRISIGVVVSIIVFISTAICVYRVDDFAQYKKNYPLSDNFLYAEDGRALNIVRTDFTKKNRIWTDLDRINPDFIQNLLQQEDKRFYKHPGVDPLALASSVVHYGTGSGPLRGASTISMQLAKQLFKINSRTVAGKIKQIAAAISIEFQWSKLQIIEAYLNVISLHGEIQGIGTASLALFDKVPLYLTAAERNIMLQLIKNPNLLLKNSKYKARYDDIKLASHYQQFLLNNNNYNAHTSIDYDLQIFAIQSLQNHLRSLQQKNVHDAAVLVLDNKTQKVLAYVGNSGTEFSQTPYVDMVQTFRSAGSALKPFLYAQALENKFLNLNSWIEDTPVDIVFPNGTYSPRNHDQVFHGWVHPGQALGSSLNVPAVKTIQMIGVDRFWSTLKRLDFTLEREPDYYGPSLALGTLDVSLWQLAHAYQKMVLKNDQTFSDETKNKIVWMISNAQNRSLSFGLDSILNIPQGFAVKTGTSKDMKDNWCVGFNRNYTVAVWVGNSDNSSMQNVLGVAGAAPIWRDVVNYLLKNKSKNDLPLLATDLEKKYLTEIDSSTPPEVFSKNTIMTPAHNSIYAIDPAIPLKSQRLVLEAKGPQNQLVWKHNGEVISGKTWSLKKGRQKIELFSNGKKVDETTFLVK